MKYFVRILGDKDIDGKSLTSMSTALRRAIILVNQFPDLKVVVVGTEGVVNYVRYDGKVKWDEPLTKEIINHHERRI